MSGSNFLLYGFDNRTPGTWQWWTASLVGTMRTFLAAVKLRLRVRCLPLAPLYCLV